MNDNSVIVTGNVTRDPELRFTSGGRATTSFGLAVNRRWQNKTSGEMEEAVSFFDVITWGSLAENVAESAARGTRVTVSGRLDQRRWETETGEKRSKIEIVADDVALSLLWATGTVKKTERGGGGRQGSGGSENGNAPQHQAGAPAPRQSQARRQAAPADEFDDDEIPF